MPAGRSSRGAAGGAGAESVAALTRDDILNAYSDVLVKDRVYVGAAGDITEEELGLLLDELLGDLPTGVYLTMGEAMDVMERYDVERFLQRIGTGRFSCCSM